MVGKKKNKGSKLARMSDEERARYLQHRAELELEAKRRKQQLIAIFSKNKLKCEEAFSRLNTAKINEQWRFILRQIKCKELYRDVEYLWNNFDRLIKVKNEIIQRLYKDLEIADIDHRRLQEGHIKIMSTIIGRHKINLKCLHDVYMSGLDNIKSNDLIELNQLKINMEKSCRDMQCIISKKEQNLEGKMLDTKTRNAVNMHNILYLTENATSEFIQRTSMEMENLWQRLNDVITEYEVTTEDKRKQYEYLKEQDDTHQFEVAQYPKLQLQLQNAVDAIKNDIEILSQKREKRIEQLKVKSKEVKQKGERIRHKLTVSQTLDSMQLKNLSVTSNNVLKDLRKASEKGTAILQFIKMCSNLEPLLFNLRKYFIQDTEFVAPIPQSSVTKSFDKLQNFWEQYNHVKAGNILLRKENDELSAENQRLRHTLRTYLITVSGIPAPRPFTSVPLQSVQSLPLTFLI